MNLIKLTASFVVFSIFLSACSDSYESQIENISDFIDVTYETGPQIGQHEILTVWIENQTDFCISFPLGYGIRNFVETSDGWKEVPNLGKFVGTEPRLLKPKNDFFSEDTVNVRPDISGLGLTKPTNFYVTISGQLCDDESVLIEKKIPYMVVP
jgi:hypothetical protein